MSVPNLQFVLPKKSKPIDYIEELIEEQGFVLEQDLVFTRTFLDTFDWRLYAKGYLLISDAIHKQQKSTLQSRTTGETLGVMVNDQLPVFVNNFKSSRIQRIFGPIIEMRALLPQTTIQCQQSRLILLDKRKKTVLKLRIESYKVENQNQEWKKLPPRGYLESVRGYEKIFRRSEKLLIKRMNVKPVQVDLLSTALNKVGRYPQDYSSALNFKLEPSIRADSATRIMFRQIYSTMEANESGTKQNIDSEFLHDFRVAVRRTRSLLSLCDGILPGSVIKKFSREFSWLGQRTSLARDLQVYLLKYVQYQNRIPVSIRKDLEPLRDFLILKEKSAVIELVETLESGRYTRLKKNWRKFLASPVKENPKEVNADSKLKEIADNQIWQEYKLIRRNGQIIDQNTAPEYLHRLRKDCKRLRYLIEFYESLYSRKQIQILLRSLKKLQNNLGDFQDLEVQQLTLKQYSNEMMASGTRAQTLLAMGVLMQELEKQRIQVRQEFLQTFTAFNSNEKRMIYRVLFANGKGAA